MVLALKPIHDLFNIKKLLFQPINPLLEQEKLQWMNYFIKHLDVYKNKPLMPNFFSKRIAFNLIPQIDSFLEDGSTKEEKKMIDETQKFLILKLKFTLHV